MLEVMRDTLQSSYLRSNVAHKQWARSTLFVFRWKMVWKIIFSCIFRRFQSRFDIYSCGQDHIGGYAVIQVKHRSDINLRRFERVFRCYSVCETMNHTKEGYFIVYANYKYLLQLYCWAIPQGQPWRHIRYHGKTPGQQKGPLNFSFCKLSEKISRWPTVFISLLEISLNSITS